MNGHLDAILARLEEVTGFRPVQSGDDYKARCPVHEADGRNHTPSLSVRQGEQQDVLMNCHAGCQYGDIVVALGLEGTPAHAARRIVATYPYCDAAGTALFEKVRYAPKDFRIRHCPAPGAPWVWKRPDLKEYPLYCLPELLAAKEPGGTIYVVEGEKDVDRAATCGLVATCNWEGASEPGKKPKWRKEYTAHLAGAARVVLIPDNDTPGRAHMRHIARQLTGQVADLRWLELPGVPPKGDLSDFLDRHPVEELLALIEAAPPPPPERIDATATPPANPAPEPDPNPATPAMPTGFRLTPTALEYRGKGHEVTDPDTGEITVEHAWQPIAGPLKVVAHGRDAESGGWALVCEFADYEGKRHVEVLPREALAEPTPLRAALLRAGLHLEPDNAAKNALVTYLHRVNPGRYVRLIDRPGWHGAAYVLPDATIGVSEEPLLLNPPPRLNPYQVRGTVADWQNEIGRLCIGNSRLILAVCAALAAPLLTPFGLESGGIHFRFASSTGKTTALIVAASVCGAPNRGGIVESWKATQNGLEGLAANHHDAVLLLDELQQLDGRQAGDAAYLLANGTGKQRAERDGSAAHRRAWKLLFLSTGEISLAEHMRAAGKRPRAGQEVRLLELPAPEEAAGMFENLHGFSGGRDLSDALISAAQRLHGAPFRAWLEHLTANLDPLINELQESIHRFKQEHTPPRADGQVHRGVSRLGLLAAAGELATRLGITGWSAGAAWEAAEAGLATWLNDRGGPGAREDMEALAQVRKFLELHGDSRFTPWHCQEHTIANRAGFRKADDQGDGARFYLFPEVFKTEVCAGLDWKRVARVMVERGWLVTDSDGKATRKERLPGIGLTRCFVVVGSKVFGDEETCS